MDIDAYSKRAAEIEAERNALLKFKEYVHARLDAAGVPTHPDGPHSEQGCRIGDRLDIALSAIDLLRELDKYEDFGEPITAGEATGYEDPSEVNVVRQRAQTLVGICSATEPVAREDGDASK